MLPKKLTFNSIEELRNRSNYPKILHLFIEGTDEEFKDLLDTASSAYLRAIGHFFINALAYSGEKEVHRSYICEYFHAHALGLKEIKYTDPEFRLHFSRESIKDDTVMKAMIVAIRGFVKGQSVEAIKNAAILMRREPEIHGLPKSTLTTTNGNGKVKKVSPEKHVEKTIKMLGTELAITDIDFSLDALFSDYYINFKDRKYNTLSSKEISLLDKDEQNLLAALRKYAEKNGGMEYFNENPATYFYALNPVKHNACLKFLLEEYIKGLKKDTHIASIAAVTTTMTTTTTSGMTPAKAVPERIIGKTVAKKRRGDSDETKGIAKGKTPRMTAAEAAGGSPEKYKRIKVKKAELDLPFCDDQELNQQLNFRKAEWEKEVAGEYKKRLDDEKLEEQKKTEAQRALELAKFRQKEEELMKKKEKEGAERQKREEAAKQKREEIVRQRKEEETKRKMEKKEGRRLKEKEQIKKEYMEIVTNFGAGRIGIETAYAQCKSLVQVLDDGPDHLISLFFKSEEQPLGIIFGTKLYEETKEKNHHPVIIRDCAINYFELPKILDKGRAYSLFNLALEKDPEKNSCTTFYLGMIYLEGIPNVVPIDKQQAIAYLQKSAQDGDKNALLVLGLTLLEINPENQEALGIFRNVRIDQYTTSDLEFVFCLFGLPKKERKAGTTLISCEIIPFCNFLMKIKDQAVLDNFLLMLSKFLTEILTTTLCSFLFDIESHFDKFTGHFDREKISRIFVNEIKKRVPSEKEILLLTELEQTIKESRTTSLPALLEVVQILRAAQPAKIGEAAQIQQAQLLSKQWDSRQQQTTTTTSPPPPPASTSTPSYSL